MSVWQIVLIVVIVVAAILAGLFFWGRNIQGKYEEQQKMIDDNKQQAQIFVLDKKKDKIANAKLPKQVKEGVPRLQRRKKMPLVIAKIGPQISTLLCDDSIYKQLPVKKRVNVELAGIFIVSVKGPNRINPNKSKKQGWFSKLKQKAQNQMDKMNNS